jgi:hypothetical protein
MSLALIELIQTMIVTTVMVFITVLIHYEILRWASDKITTVCHWHGRAKILFIITACLTAHTLEVWAFAFSFYLMRDIFMLGDFGGAAVTSVYFVEYIYFSITSYTSLGIGDMYPIGGLRLLTGVEALIGLLMIAWSASITYISMERFWKLGKKTKF